MNFIYYPNKEEARAAFGTDELYIMAISFDGETAVIAPNDEAFEHHILLAKVGIRETAIEKYFRVVFDNKTAEWTFVCPADYRNITDKVRRIAEFYKDGFRLISSTLAELGYFVDLNIPKRYKRHFDLMNDNTYLS